MTQWLRVRPIEHGQQGLGSLIPKQRRLRQRAVESINGPWIETQRFQLYLDLAYLERTYCIDVRASCHSTRRRCVFRLSKVDKLALLMEHQRNASQVAAMIGQSSC